MRKYVVRLPSPFDMLIISRESTSSCLCKCTPETVARHLFVKLSCELTSFQHVQMSGRWGIGYRIGATKDMNLYYDVDAFIEQLRTIGGDPGWIIINLSGPALDGDVYLTYNPTLWEIGNVHATPGPNDRDLFGEILKKVKAEGLKVIAYMATQGPGMCKMHLIY